LSLNLQEISPNFNLWFTQFTMTQCLASSVGEGISCSEACSLMCAGDPGSIPGADKLDSRFYSAKLKRAAVRWSGAAFAARAWRTLPYVISERLARARWK